MNRYTEKSETGYIVKPSALKETAEGYMGEAIERLAHFENLYDHLQEQQNVLTEEMEKLKAAGRGNCVKFKQLMSSRMTNAHILNLLEE